MSLKARLQETKKRVIAAASRVGRDPAEISIIAVSKTKSSAQILEAVDAGQELFGENYVQEALRKREELGERFDRVSLHLVGHLQRNKVKHAVGLFDTIQTVDNPALAEEISKIAVKSGIKQNVFVQVNISGEDAKSGIAPSDAAEFCRFVNDCENLNLNGLMMIGRFLPEGVEEDVRRSEFAMLRDLKERIQKEQGIVLSELSMGMSGDFEIAIEEGATMVRIGSAIFGSRE